VRYFLDGQLPRILIGPVDRRQLSSYQEPKVINMNLFGFGRRKGSFFITFVNGIWLWCSFFKTSEVSNIKIVFINQHFLWNKNISRRTECAKICTQKKNFWKKSSYPKPTVITREQMECKKIFFTFVNGIFFWIQIWL
jgi:hypothetical protein